MLASKPRTTTAAALVAALIAALLVALPATAHAVEAEPDALAQTSACVGAATQDRGFADVAPGSVFEDAINCIAHYGITRGCSDGTIYCGRRDVSRWQMALFLHRASKVAGIELSSGSEVALSDITDMPQEWQTAITEIVAAGIMDYPPGDMFNPSDPVPRRDMAYYLVRFVAAANPDRVEIDSERGRETVLISPDGDGTGFIEPDDSFTDLRFETYRHLNSIQAAYELGITDGTGDGSTFSPSNVVNRGQMAAFITRMLGHTTAKPVGLSAQMQAGELVASLRASSFAPVVNEPIHAFYAAEDQAHSAFDDDDGSCRSRAVTVLPHGFDADCEIDYSTPITDSEGDAYFSGLDDDNIDEPVVVWVWTGDYGDTFDIDNTDHIELRTDPYETPVEADGVEVTPERDDTPRRRFGSSHTWEVQLIGYDNNGEDVPAPAPRSGATYMLRLSQYVVPSENLAEYESGGTAPEDAGLISRMTSDLELDDSGAARIRLSASDVRDPDATDPGDFVLVEYSLTPGEGAPLARHTDNLTGFVIFGDAAGVPNSVEVESRTPSRAAPDSGLARNTVVVSVFDEYGEPYRGAAVTASSSTAEVGDEAVTCPADGGLSTFPTSPRYTTRRGSAPLTYTYTGGPAVETVCVTVDLTPDDDSDDSMELIGSVTMYWTTYAAPESNSDDQVLAEVFVVDTVRDRIVASADGTLYELFYDRGDYFHVEGTEDGEDGPVSPAEFERVLQQAHDDEDKTVTLGWEFYDYDDPDRIASWDIIIAAG